jgi:uncharacterized protein
MHAPSRRSLLLLSLILILFPLLASVRFVLAAPQSPQTSQNPAASISDLQSAAQKADSEYCLAKSMLANHPSPSDIQSALQALRASAAQNNPRAEFYLGYLYEHGQFVPRDYALAFQNYQSAAAQQFPVAENNLAALYQHGRGVAKNDAKAFELYLASARHGDPVAQLNLASLYYSGTGTSRNYTETIHWLRVAADAGIPDAQNNLAYFYFYGVSIQRDYTEAARLLRLAAQQGLPAAETSLAYLYELGKGVPLDYVAAYTWYSRALAAGDNTGAARRNQLAHIMTTRQLGEATSANSNALPPPLQPASPPTTAFSLVTTH